ncbi:protein of unknown function [Mucilaginibacter mallensis]|uniref:DUF4397 domain-containing protein n=1 Tax=Mucilaginibacter mallensis TaxID=652787 RepID=A0A1H1QWW8_MUCMA|nr:protein of unknown function [Mucilaginibacter mallensis]
MACNKKDLAPATVAIANLAVVNATADTLNFLVNNSRQNSFSGIYPAGAYGLYTPAGTQNYEIKKERSAVNLFIGTYSLSDTSKHIYTSLFIAGESADKTFFTTDAIDSALTVYAKDTAHIDTIAMLRFVHASYTSGPLHVVFDKGDTINIANAAYKYKSQYFKVYEGTRTIKIYPANSTTLLLDTTITLQSGAVYTLFAKGILNAKGYNAFGVSLMTNGTIITATGTQQ